MVIICGYMWIIYGLWIIHGRFMEGSWIIYGILASSVEKHGFIASGNACQWWFMLKHYF